MKPNKPSQTLSERYQISLESAKYFLVQVQKSFKKSKPPERMILDLMDSKNFPTLPKPYRIAKLLHTSGLWAFPLNAEPRSPEDEPDLYF